MLVRIVLHTCSQLNSVAGSFATRIKWAHGDIASEKTILIITSDSGAASTSVASMESDVTSSPTPMATVYATQAPTVRPTPTRTPAPPPTPKRTPAPTHTPRLKNTTDAATKPTREKEKSKRRIISHAPFAEFPL